MAEDPAQAGHIHAPAKCWVGRLGWSDRVSAEACLLLFFYEILVDSTLATRRTGEQKFSCLQFASSAHNVASDVMETVFFV